MMCRLKMLACWLLAATVGLTAGTRCEASIVFDNGNHVSDGGAAFGAFRVADDFWFAATTTITDVHWKGVYFGNPIVDDFVINIYNDNGLGMPTAPGTAIFSQTVGAVSRAATGESVAGQFAVYAYSTFVDPFVAQAGNVYWLEIYNANASTTSSPWYWSKDTSGGNGVSTDGGSSWIAKSDVYTFQLTDDGVAPVVPEAASLAIWVVAGAFGLFAGYKAKRRKL